MRFEQDVATVVGLVLDLEPELDRDEWRALLRLAHFADRTLNRQTTSNPLADTYFARPSHLARRAGCNDARCRACTREPDRSFSPSNEKLRTGQEALAL